MIRLTCGDQYSIRATRDAWQKGNVYPLGGTPALAAASGAWTSDETYRLDG